MPIKKTVYISLVIFLWLLIAQIVHWLIEIVLVNMLLDEGLTPKVYNVLGIHCFLPPYLQFGLLIFGLIAGYFCGQTWWRIIYVEKRYCKKKSK